MLRHLRKKHPLEFTKKEDETKAAKGANSPNTVLNYMRKLGNWKVGSEKYVAMEKKTCEVCCIYKPTIVSG